MNTLNPVGIAVPIFFGLMAIELIASWFQKKKVYRFNDTISNLGCGIGDQLLGLFTKVFTVGIYAYVYDNYAFLSLDSNNLWVWATAFIFIDFCYYWYHRESHLVSLFWATHSVHHQSEEYNLAVALRQSWFAKFFAWIFYIPAALFGFPPLMFVLCYSINLFYQFWIHTKLIDRMGFLEIFMNTPSHHRVHHGTNEIYLDKNYAGVFIIWDRIFGSFQPELNHDPPVYGVLAPIGSWNPIITNAGPLQKIFRLTLKTKNISLGLQTLFREPGWLPPTVEAPRTLNRGYDRDNRTAHMYVGVQFFLVTVAMTLLLTFSAYIEWWFLLPAAICTVLIPITTSGYLEKRTWAFALEAIRNVCVLIIVFCNPYTDFYYFGIGFAVLSLMAFLVMGRTKPKMALET